MSENVLYAYVVHAEIIARRNPRAKKYATMARRFFELDAPSLVLAAYADALIA